MPKQKEGNGVWIFLEQKNGKILNIVYELISAARPLAKKLDEDIVGVILGNQVQDLAEQILSYGLDKVIVGEHPQLEKFHDEKYSLLLTKIIKEKEPEIVLIGGTVPGRSLAPRIAASLNTGLTADCTDFELDQDGNLLQTRPTFGGNLMATIICPDHRPQMATVRPKVFPIAEKTNKKGEIKKYPVSESLFSKMSIKLLEMKEEKTKSTNIREADIIVAGGRGLKKPKNFKLIRKLADILEGAVGASRPVVDEGWISYSHQVGQTGKTVNPKLYIACGISGAIQHLAGMQSSDYIVAINPDDQAPIFNVADYGILEDVREFIPELINFLS